jgi:hypothetical protein
MALIRNLHINFFKATMAISTLGAYFTFQIAMQPLEQPQDADNRFHIFHTSTAQLFVALAWVLFLISLGGSAIAALTLSFGHAMDRSYRSAIEDPNALAAAFHSKKKAGLLGWDPEMWSAVSAGAMFLTMLFAFMFCCLALTAYSPVPGIAGVVIVVAFMIVTLTLWIRHILSVGPNAFNGLYSHINRSRRRSRRTSILLESGRVSRLGPDLEAGLWNMMTAGGTLPIQTQQVNSNPAATQTTQKTITPMTTGVRPPTRRHQPIIIKDPRMPSQAWTPV